MACHPRAVWFDRRIPAAPSLLNLVLFVLAAACGSSSGDAEKKSSGTFRMPLTGQTNGNTYRLRSATFEIADASNPAATTSLDTEVNPEATVLSTTLAVGDYTIDLQDGWFLERLDVGSPTPLTYVPVQARLMSPDPTTFTIASGATTSVVYVFEVPGSVVVIGDGTLNVTIDVIESVCGNGAVEGTEQCDDGNIANGDGCSVVCTLETTTLGAIGAACTSGGSCASGGCIDEPSSGFPGGYCSAVCLSDPDCGAGAVCGTLDLVGASVCFATCSTAGDCRPGYTCSPSGNGISAPTPICIPL